MAQEKKKALITGITGQDGSYLAELLLEKGYEVHGIVRRTSSFNRDRIKHLHNPYNNVDKVYLHYGDMGDAMSLIKAIQKIQPDEIYNLAAQSHVGISFGMSEYTHDVNALGVSRVIDAIRFLELKGKTKFYQASTSELFGNAVESPQKETTPFNPVSPYGISKKSAFDITAISRREGIFAVNGILFNHESPRRGENFVTRKITQDLAGIVNGTKDKIRLGNLDAKRDWGYAKEYVEAMWLMLQQDKADDYVIATGETHSIREFLEASLNYADIKAESNGRAGVDEKYIDKTNGKIIVEIDPKFFRPNEINTLVGDYSRQREN